MTAAISPTWLDWAFLGIRRALFLGSSWANQTPLLQHAFLLLLFMQALSVYTVISLHHRVGPQCLYLQAIWVGILLGSMKIRKHLARLSLQVIDGSKVITPFVSLAWLFLCFRDLVRDRLSRGSCFSRLCLGGIRFSLVRASAAHLCGFSHPIFLSFVHSVHVQFLVSISISQSHLEVAGSVETNKCKFLHRHGVQHPRPPYSCNVVHYCYHYRYSESVSAITTLPLAKQEKEYKAAIVIRNLSSLSPLSPTEFFSKG